MLGCAAGGLALSCFAPNASAQDDRRRLERVLRSSEQDWRLRVDPGLSVAERTLFEYGGFFAFTGLWLDDASNNARRLLQYDTTLFARASLDGVHTGFVRLRFPYQEFSEGDSFDGRGDQWKEPFLDRYTYEFDLARHMAAYEGQSVDYNFNLRVGRQFVDWGAGITLSETLLSVRPKLTFGRNLEFDMLAGVTPDTAVDFDASRADFDRRTRRGFFGLKVQYTTTDGTRYYAYALRMQDYHTDSQLRSPLPGLTDAFFDYNATYYGIGTEGTIGANWVYLGEFVWEAGEATSDPVRTIQTRERVEAYAGRAQLTYLFRDDMQTRAQLEALFASGDGDRVNSTNTVDGNLSGTTDSGFNSLGFANTGLAFSPSFSNLWTIRAGASTFPLPRDEWFRQLQVGADVLFFNKLNENGGFDEVTSSDMYLGSEIDLFANWRITSDVAVNLRYGVFFPGTAITGPNDTRHFVLLGVTISF
ncbi:MAG: alginate export family protein [Phycisphaerales bacterium]